METVGAAGVQGHFAVTWLGSFEMINEHAHTQTRTHMHTNWLHLLKNNLSL